MADFQLEFMADHPQHIVDGNAINFLSDDGGDKYNLCHCKPYFAIRHRWLIVLVWSNFEIADMDFWRGPAYTDFFNYLEEQGGFYYEVRVILSLGLCVALMRVQRWGDAPVHSIAAALFVKKEQIHFWDEIGYEHNPYTHCPQKEQTWKEGKCSCSQQRSFGKCAP